MSDERPDEELQPIEEAKAEEVSTTEDAPPEAAGGEEPIEVGVDPAEELPTRESTPPTEEAVYCPQCGAGMDGADAFCGSCGWRVGQQAASTAPPAGRVITNPSDLNRLTALLLCFFIGFLGAHRFYVGKIGTGLLYLFTLGFLSVGVIYDLVMIATGEFTDSSGRRLYYWQ